MGKGSDGKGPAMGSISDMFAFAGTNTLGRFFEFLKILVFGGLLMMVGMALMVLLAGAGAVGAMLGFVLMLVFVVLGCVAMYTMYNYVDNEMNGKPTGIVEHTKANMVPVIEYIVVFCIVGVVLQLIPVLGQILWLLFCFFAMFTILEMLLNRKGVIEAIKASFNLVKENLVSAIGLLVAVIVLSVIIGLLVGFLMVLTIGPVLMEYAVQAQKGVVDPAMLMGSAATMFMVFMAVLFFLIMPFSMLFMTPLFYGFWKRAGG
ncbi:MAG: hypothetical protein ACP5NX_01155 [Candidatus Bilamarchaeaceae archaeon]